MAIRKELLCILANIGMPEKEIKYKFGLWLLKRGPQHILAV
jgi:hypothetical protein